MIEPQNGEADDVRTEVVFIGKPGASSERSLRAHFEKAFKDAAEGKLHLVKDLRTFDVIFA